MNKFSMTVIACRFSIGIEIDVKKGFFSEGE